MTLVKLTDVGKLSRGKSKHRPRNDAILYGGPYPFIQTSDIKKSNHILKNYSQTYSEFGLKQSKLWKKGTICITIAANIADTAILGLDACFPDSVLGLEIDKNKADVDYIEYLLQYYKKNIQLQSNGTSQENINIETFDKVLFDIPELSYQKSIAKVLSSIDEKIELNNKINSKLEQMAKTLYDYWFVQFEFPAGIKGAYKSSNGQMVYNEILKRKIPVGWEVKKLKSCIKHINTGLNPRDNFILNNGNIKYITVKNISTDGTLDFSNCDTINETSRNIIHQRSDIKKGDILFASISPLGRCFLIQEDPKNWDINESVFSIRVNSDILIEYVYMFLMSDYFVKKAENSATGSVFSGIRIKTLEDIMILVPDSNTLQSFKKSISKILFLKYKINEENRTLSEARDFLLPMLMNGQVSVVQP